jgi:hypothetical protein
MGTLKPGLRLKSQVSEVAIVVVIGNREADLRCGDLPMVEQLASDLDPSESVAGETLLGKRYVDSSGTVEVLCVTAGHGSLSCDGSEMSVKAAKALPSSD